MVDTIRKGVKFSEISFPLRGWRYLFLFQSHWQLLSWLVWVLLACVCIFVIFSMLGMRDIPARELIIGTLIGAAISLLMVVYGEVTVCNADRFFLTRLTDYLSSIKYVEESRGDGYIIYRQDLPRILRWDEGNVCVDFNEGVVRIAGAYFALKLIRTAFD